ncbi:5'-methylthioadenosine/adenosylhomocysteine nucleosidase [Clostridium sp.]|jgi:adenosylhomocysteine nucleosidase|uniref:5'-methylthioadenosine/adenosylhomocysteine nucleosidase n=1 Tax=Clostridium sp. TaxID=1506 RepID=UPI0025904D01|nr:5'-methylthioadenosine/adenosylhomocysteine nucleosidase [Clostridium sp.]MDF2504021.1 5-methylthioadenosine/S-adenosylhomocysteine nucleosidase [Clostridium sp.]
MIIGIIGAMDEELELLLKEIKLEKKENKASMEFNCGELYGKTVVIVRCGIGKVNAAVCTQVLIDDFNVDSVINVGIAGGIGKDIFPGDIVIAENLVQHDMDTSAFGDKIGQIPRLNTYDFKCDNELVELAKKACASFEKNFFMGRIVTGDQFVADIEKIKWLSKDFGAVACEMEGGSIAQVCYLNEIPFVVIRSISDNANNGAHMDYEKFTPIAVKNSTNILENMIKIM